MTNKADQSYWNHQYAEFNLHRRFRERCMLWGLRMLKPLLKRVLPRHRKSWSPFCGVIARKR